MKAIPRQRQKPSFCFTQPQLGSKPPGPDLTVNGNWHPQPLVSPKPLPSSRTRNKNTCCRPEWDFLKQWLRYSFFSSGLLGCLCLFEPAGLSHGLSTLQLLACAAQHPAPPAPPWKAPPSSPHPERDGKEHPPPAWSLSARHAGHNQPSDSSVPQPPKLEQGGAPRSRGCPTVGDLLPGAVRLTEQ